MSLSELDTTIFFLINRDLRNSFFDVLMPLITTKAYLFFMPFFLWLFWKDRKKAVITLAIALASVLISDWFSFILKNYFERVRPCNALAGVRELVGCGKSFSIPSNHAVNAFAFATPFYVMFKNRVRVAFIAISLTVGFSRVYVGVHYPADVLAGSVFGILMAMSVIKLYTWSSERYKTEPYTTILLIFLLSLSLFRIYYIQNGPFDLSPDETHYWEWSRRLDLSYYSKGPMIAYLIYLGTSVFGDSAFGIRIMAVILSTLSSIFIYILGKDMYDKKTGLWSAILLQIIPLFSTFGVIFTIDSPFIFFWILSLYFFWKAISYQLSEIKSQETTPPSPPLTKGGNGGVNNSDLPDKAFWVNSKLNSNSSLIYWLLLGLSIGLGLLTKYTMAFFYICAFLFFISSKERRSLLLSRGPYIAFLISIMLFSPVILWNADHGWVTLKHTAGQAHLAQGLALSFQSFLEFFGSQFLVITPLLLILIAFSVWKVRRNFKGMLLFWFSVPVIVFFILKSAQGKVQANWALPGYITGIVAFSSLYLMDFRSVKKVGKIVLITALLLSFIVSAASYYPSAFLVPAEIDPSLRLLGGRLVEVTRIHDEMSASRPVFIFSDKYQISSELAFYVKDHPVTYCINLGRRMNQYDLWPGFDNLIHYDAVFVRSGDVRIPEKVASAFQKVEKKVFTAYTKKHVKIRDYSIFMCYGFKGLIENIPEKY